MDRSGENQARGQFARQLTEHRGRVYAWVVRQVGPNNGLAEDVTQDCFVRVWETRRSNPPPAGALHTYLLTTARNLLRDRFRRQSTAVLFTELEQTTLADAATPETRLLLRDTAERLAAEAALLPLVLRETLRLRVEEGLDYADIAARTGCPVGTVRSRLGAARGRLVSALSEQENLPTAGDNAQETYVVRRQTAGNSVLTTTVRQERKTMAHSTSLEELNKTVQAMEARLCALEDGDSHRTASNDGDPWDAPSRRLKEELDAQRRENGGAFALGLVHMVTQSASVGNSGTALGVTTFGSVADLPDNKTVDERVERMRLLAADPAVARVFRHFYALRFAGRLMRATTEELAEATEETPEKITALLAPLLAKRNLLFVRNGDGSHTYEWEGYDPAIATLLFAAA